MLDPKMLRTCGRIQVFSYLRFAVDVKKFNKRSDYLSHSTCAHRILSYHLINALWTTEPNLISANISI